MISGNSYAGIEIDGYYGATSGNVIAGNDIGTDVTGTLPVSNRYGVLLDAGASDNTIGGTSSGDANTIAFNNGPGISVGLNSTDTTIGDEILGNSIYSNGSIGIDLGNDGVTPNDSEGHSGPNLYQNFPVITAATSSITNASISATLSSTPNTTFTIQFFASSNLLNQAGGETYLGELTNVMTDSSGNKSFTFSCPAIEEPYITATATDPNGNTSEFSIPFFATVPTPIVVTNTNDSGDGSLRAAIQSADADYPTPQIITFDIPGFGVQIISPQTPLPPITTPVLIDGTSQPGYTGTPLIELDSVLSDGFTGLDITAGGADSTIKGLDITDWNVGIEIEAGATGVQVIGNWIGIYAGGFAELANYYGVEIDGSGNTVGGTTPASRNVISGNLWDGVILVGSSATDNVVEGNEIGTDGSGGKDGSSVPNLYDGVEIAAGASNNTIGGVGTGARNVISGNTYYGVEIDGTGTTGNVVEGNYVGTDASGTNEVGNGAAGIFIAYGALGQFDRRRHHRGIQCRLRQRHLRRISLQHGHVRQRCRRQFDRHRLDGHKSGA